MTTNHTKLSIAHRGLWDSEVPENSMGAFERCIKENIPIELDVHKLKDDTLVVFHDDNLARMTGVDKMVKDCTYEEIKDLTLVGTNYTIPTFKEVLDLVDGQVLLDIELKFVVPKFKICSLLARLLDEYKGNFLIKSFSPFHIAWFRFKRPHYERGLLVSSLKDANMPDFLKRLFFSMKFNFLAKPQFIAFDHRDLPNEKLEKIHNKGIPMYLWVIRGENPVNLYDGIIFERMESVNKKPDSVKRMSLHLKR